MADSKKKKETKKKEEPAKLIILGTDPLAPRVASWYLTQLRNTGRDKEAQDVQDFIKKAKDSQ